MIRVLVRRFIYNILTLTVAQWGSGRSPGRALEEAEEFLLSIRKISTFSGIKRSFYCDFIINEYNVNID